MQSTLKNRLVGGELYEEYRNLKERAEQGDRSAIPRLKQFFAEYPELWRHSGDLVVQAKKLWVKRIARSNKHFQEAIVASMNLDLSLIHI